MIDSAAGDRTGSARLRIVFLGTPEPAVPSLKAVIAAGHEVSLVVTRPDRRRGRGGGAVPSPVMQAAIDAGLPAWQPEKVNASESVARIRDAAPDALLIVAYGQILREPIIEAPRLIPMNLHFSLLPEYRGAAPVVKAIADGKTETGVTMQRIVRRLDAGPVLASVGVSIGPCETAGELESRLAEVGAQLVVRTLERLAKGEVRETPQDDSLATYARMLEKKDGIIDWTRSAEELRCHVRAMNPWPGARTTLALSSRGGGTLDLTVIRAVAAGESEGSPGNVVAAGPEGIFVATGEGLLDLRLLKPAGKRELTSREFLNGYRPAAGDRFYSGSKSS